MSLSDDIFDLEAHFGETSNADLLNSWERVIKSHADLERYQMATEEVIGSIATIFNIFGVQRVVSQPEKHNDE